MANAWGVSFGVSWGVSWGTTRVWDRLEERVYPSLTRPEYLRGYLQYYDDGR